MLNNNREVRAIEHEQIGLKKDIHWKIKNKICVVRNVPCYQGEYDGEETVDLLVAMTLAMLRKMMYEEIIQLDVDYIDYADF